MASRVQHITKIKCYSGIKCASQFQQKNLRNFFKDRFNNVYNINGEPGHFYDIEDLEDNEYFDEYALFDVSPPDAGKISLIMKVMNLLRKEGTSQITIHLIQSMLKFHNIKSKM